MVWWLLFLIIIVIMFTISWLSSRFIFDEFDKWDSEGEIAFVIRGIIFSIIGCLLCCATPRQVTKTESFDLLIESFADKFFVTGSFTMGSGEISEEMKYTAYYLGNDGSLKLLKVPQSQVTIRYTTGLPKITVYREYKNYKYIKGMADEKEDDHFTFYIPRGSIKTVGFDGL